jgi:hypothetical protein
VVGVAAPPAAVEDTNADGTVRDADTGVAIPGIIVRIYQVTCESGEGPVDADLVDQTVTDEDGHYDFDDLPATHEEECGVFVCDPPGCPYAVRYTGFGYDAYSGPFPSGYFDPEDEPEHVTAAPATDVRNIHAPDTYGTITGVVHDHFGAGYDDMVISAERDQEDTSAPWIEMQTVPKPDGTYLLRVPANMIDEDGDGTPEDLLTDLLRVRLTRAFPASPACFFENTGLEIVPFGIQVLGTGPQADASDVMITGVDLHCGPPSGFTGTSTLTGTPRVGSVITVHPGAVTPAGAAFTYRWGTLTFMGRASAIPGATGATLVVPPSALGKRVFARLDVAPPGHAPDFVLVGPTLEIGKGVFKVVTGPSIKGVAKVGKKLSAKPGTLTPAPAKLAYQWLRDGVKIPKATKATYRLKNADRGHKMSVRVTYSRPAFVTKTLTSPKTGKVRS